MKLLGLIPLVILAVLPTSGFAEIPVTPTQCSQWDFAKDCGKLEAGSKQQSYASYYKVQGESITGAGALESPYNATLRCRNRCYDYNSAFRNICYAKAAGIAFDKSGGAAETGYSNKQIRMQQNANVAYYQLIPAYRNDPNAFTTAMRGCHFGSWHVQMQFKANEIAVTFQLGPQTPGVADGAKGIAHQVRLLVHLEGRCEGNVMLEFLQGIANAPGATGQLMSLALNMTGPPAGSGDVTGKMSPVTTRITREQVFAQANTNLGLSAGAINSCPRLVCHLARSLPNSNDDVADFLRTRSCAAVLSAGIPHGSPSGRWLHTEPDHYF